MTESELRERIKQLEKESALFLKEHLGVLSGDVLTKPLKFTSINDQNKYHQIKQEIAELLKQLSEANERNY